MSYRTDYPSYSAAHRRVVSMRGKAVEWRCVDCGGAAEEWSYDHADPDALIHVMHGREIKYSANPEHYDPRCRECHLRFDCPPRTPSTPLPSDPRCGTYAGAVAHSANKTPRCQPCRIAAREYMRAHRAKNRQIEEMGNQ